MGLHKKSTAVAGSTMTALALSLSAYAADPYPPVPGSYRPTRDLPAQNNRQFMPSGRSSAPPPVTYTPNPPQTSYYPAPPTYSNDPRQFNPPTFDANPGSLMNNMFNPGSNNLPYGYPLEPLTGRVAPVYDSPLPAATPDWNSYVPQAVAPAYPQQPATNQYWQQPSATQPGTYQGGSVFAQPAYTPPNPAPTTAPQPVKPAARPFSNPQETGNTFVQRASPAVGRNDNRFRPPELKGNP